MRIPVVLLSGLALIFACGNARAVDQIRSTSGSFMGTIKEITPLKVSIETRTGDLREIPANELLMVAYDNEPSSLRDGRRSIGEGEYEEALNRLQRVEEKELTRPMAQDLQYYRALASARLALAGAGEIKEAGRMMNDFVRTHPTSYHFFDACQMVGDLLVAAGAHGPAVAYYSRVAESPWPEYRMRAGVALGRSLLAQRKTDEASKAFDNVLAMKGKGDSAEAQRQAATLGKARCFAEGGKPEEAMKIAQETIEKTDSEQVELQAEAHNTLGTALRKLKRDKEALMAFLHTDLLYSNSGEAHAEALSNLADLWNVVHQPDRALRAKQTLEERYKNSPWAKK